MSFEQLGLASPILKAVADKGYTTPTPIQSATIEAVLGGQDVMASAQTGTGKTAAFTLPVLQRLGDSRGHRAKPRALILTPTRELAAQIQASIETYGKYMDLTATVVFGGVKIGPQISRLRNGIDILVATPGRLMDLHEQRAVDLREIEIFILDEADRMLDMGFIHAIRKIQACLPRQKQTLMFSATYSGEIRDLARQFLANPVEVDVAPKNATATTVRHALYAVDKKRKGELLQKLIVENGWQQALVFSRTKHGANRLAKDLNKADINAAAIHGNKSQAQRTKALDGFKRGGVEILVATDIASRGLDISGLPLVINFDLPHVPEDYVHRIGRTGRAGAPGNALSLVSADEIDQLRGIERLIGNPIDREIVEGFDPEHALPESRSGGGGGGQRAGGQRSGGQRSGGQRSGGQRSGGQRSGGQRSGGQGQQRSGSGGNRNSRGRGRGSREQRAARG